MARPHDPRYSIRRRMANSPRKANGVTASPAVMATSATSTARLKPASGQGRPGWSIAHDDEAKASSARAARTVSSTSTITARRLPRPDSLGAFRAYVAWAATPDLTRWVRLGRVANGTSTVGPVELNKFLLVISAEPDSAPATHSGPTVLHGTSPSGWLQSFLAHPLFRGISQ